VYVAHFRHHVRNPKCQYSPEYYENDSPQSTASQRTLRLVLRRSWVDDPQLGRLRRNVIGNPWSLAVRVPQMTAAEPSKETRFRIRVGTNIVDSRETREIRKRAIDVPIFPDSVAYKVVGVDEYPRAHRSLLELSGTALRTPITVFQAAIGGVSVETQSTKWSFAYDIVCAQGFNLSPIPDDVQLIEIPTDRSLAHYRSWSCYRIRLPGEPSSNCKKWVKKLNLSPEYPEVRAAVIWPHSRGIDATGIRLFSETRSLMISTYRASPGPAFLHANVGTENLSYEIPGTIAKTSVFCLTLPPLTDDKLMLAYGIDNDAESLNWWPTDYIDILPSTMPKVETPTLHLLHVGGSKDIETVSFPSSNVASALSAIRFDRATLDDVVVPAGTLCSIKVRSTGDGIWKSASYAGSSNFSDARSILEVLRLKLHERDKDLCVVFHGFGAACILGDKSHQRSTVITDDPKWLTANVRAREAAGLGMLGRSNAQGSIVRAMARRGHSPLTALARIALHKNVAAKGR